MTNKQVDKYRKRALDHLIEIADKTTNPPEIKIRAAEAIIGGSYALIDSEPLPVTVLGETKKSDE